MVAYRTQKTAPHLYVRAEGTVTLDEVERDLAGLDEALQKLPRGYALMMEYTELRTIAVEAVDRFYYYAAQAFEAEPGLFIMVSGGRTVHPGLREFVLRLDTENVVHIVDDRAEADRLIQQYRDAREA